MNRIMEKARSAAKVTSIMALVNLSSFLQVGVQKLIGQDRDTAAFITYYSIGRESSPTDVIYGVGTRLGHQVFYDNDNYHQTAREQLERTSK